LSVGGVTVKRAEFAEDEEAGIINVPQIKSSEINEANLLEIAARKCFLASLLNALK
jgi:hypothetical protein